MEMVDEMLNLLVSAGRYSEFVISSRSSSLIGYKEDRSPVTLADFGVQAIITSWLMKEFGEFSLLAEETLSDCVSNPTMFQLLLKLLNECGFNFTDTDVMESFRANKLERENVKSFWVLDPVDGTKGFLRGGQYAISLGYIEENRVNMGFLVCPRLKLPKLLGEEVVGCIFYAEVGKGAWVVPMSDIIEKRVNIKVSSCNDFKEARLLRSYELAHTDKDKNERFKNILGISNEVPIDSQVKYGLLACGEGDLILRFPPVNNPSYREKIWDHAGGVVILEEAGGKVTDLYGNEFEFTPTPYFSKNIGVFASNGLLHSKGLEVLKEIMGN